MVETETKIQRYESYKASGVEWLGDIPEHWELTRLGTRFEERRTKVSDKDYPPLSVTKNGTVPQLSNAAKTNDGDNRKLVKKGDFVINSRSDRKGSSGIAYQDGSVSLINIVMEPLNIHPIYCNYLLKCYSFIEEFYRMGHGIVADLWTTRYDEMKAIMVGIPPLPEQTAIAQFLDDKTTKIDQAIAIKQQQIALLKERKQILIHKAVTKGVTSSAVEMKDSGVEWIGEIPEHWEVKRANYIFNKVDERSRTGKEELLSVSEHHGVIPRKNINVYMFQAESYVGYKLCKIDDLVINSIWAWSKGLAFSKYDGIISVAYSVFRLKNNSKYYPDYLNHLLRTDLYSYKFFIESKGIWKSRLQLLDWAFLRFDIISPPLSEQKEIAQYIETASAKIDTAIGFKEQEIEKLQEYKSSLIDNCVTGKIKVNCDE